MEREREREEPPRERFTRYQGQPLPRCPRTRKFYKETGEENAEIREKREITLRDIRNSIKTVELIMNMFLTSSNFIAKQEKKLKPNKANQNKFDVGLKDYFDCQVGLKVKRPEVFGKSETIKKKEFISITLTLPKNWIQTPLKDYTKFFSRQAEVYDLVYNLEKIPENLRERKLKSLCKAWLKLTKKSGKQAWKW